MLTPGWQFYGLSEEHYAASIDKEVFYKGTQSARLQAISETAPGSAGIHQIINATSFHNSRIRFTAFLKTLDVEDRCGIYLCATNGVYPAANADMSIHSPLRGTNEWQQFSVVLEVLSDHQLNFGVILSGAGTVWIDAASLETVEADVTSSATISRRRYIGYEPTESESAPKDAHEAFPSTPVNMNFEINPEPRGQ